MILSEEAPETCIVLGGLEQRQNNTLVMSISRGLQSC